MFTLLVEITADTFQTFRNFLHELIDFEFISAFEEFKNLSIEFFLLALILFFFFMVFMAIAIPLALIFLLSIIFPQFLVILSTTLLTLMLYEKIGERK